MGATELGMGDNESVQALVVRILIQNEASLRKKWHANSNRGIQCRSSGWDKYCVTGIPQEVQSEAADVGKQLLQLSYYEIGALDETAREALRSTGRRLHLLETERVFMDGGKSVRSILAQLADCQKVVEQLAASMDHENPREGETGVPH